MDVKALRKTIEANNARFGELVGAQDWAGLAGLYTEKGMVLAPDAPVVTGRKDVEEFWRSAAAALGLKAAVLKTVDLEAAGADALCEVGEATLSVASGKVKLKYLVLWQRGADGTWRLHRDIWNGMPG